MGIILKNMDEFKEKIVHIMDFWNDDITFFTWIKWKMWIQKKSHSNIKIKFEKKNHHQMKNLKGACIQTFSI